MDGAGPLGGAHRLRDLPGPGAAPRRHFSHRDAWDGPKTAADPGRRPRPLVVDDDVYWRKGWYENPNDPRWLVQDRLVPYNYSMNMAKPGAWGGTIALLAGVGILLVGLCVLFLWADFGGSSVSITSERVAVSAFLYDTEVAPKTSSPSPFWRPCRRMTTSAPTAWTTAAASSATSRGRETGPCEMYLYTAASPFWRWRRGGHPLFQQPGPRPDPNLVRRPAGRHRRDVSVRACSPRSPAPFS